MRSGQSAGRGWCGGGGGGGARKGGGAAPHGGGLKPRQPPIMPAADNNRRYYAAELMSHITGVSYISTELTVRIRMLTSVK